MDLADLVLFGAEAAGDDHFAVFGQGLADGFQRLLHRAVDKAAGVDHHQLRIIIAGHHIVPFGTQLGQDALGIDQIFGATQGDESYFGGLFCVGHRSITLRWLSYKGADFTGMANQKLYSQHGRTEQYLWRRQIPLHSTQVLHQPGYPFWVRLDGVSRIVDPLTSC